MKKQKRGLRPWMIGLPGSLLFILVLILTGVAAVIYLIVASISTSSFSLF
jgi:hypothetical protein